MKRFLVLALVLSLVLGAVWAEDAASSAPLMDVGDLAVSAGLGYGIFWGALDVSAGAEIMLGQFLVGESIPLTYGAAVKGAYYRYGGILDYFISYLGAGVFGTLHVSLKDLPWLADTAFLRNVDTYVGLGLGLYGYHDSYYGASEDEFRLGFRSTGGFNYFLSPSLAINVEGGYYGGWGGGLLGILLKL